MCYLPRQVFINYCYLSEVHRQLVRILGHWVSEWGKLPDTTICLSRMAGWEFFRALTGQTDLIMSCFVITLQIVEARKERIGQTCKACGYNGFIHMQHRLITFICKNPPNEAAATPSKK